jgi:hypothetical protein
MCPQGDDSWQCPAKELLGTVAWGADPTWFCPTPSGELISWGSFSARCSGVSAAAVGVSAVPVRCVLVGLPGFEPVNSPEKPPTASAKTVTPAALSPQQRDGAKGLESDDSTVSPTAAGISATALGHPKSTKNAVQVQKIRSTEIGLPDDLATVVSCWSNLPEVVRKSILAMVQVACPTSAEGHEHGVHDSPGGAS